MEANSRMLNLEIYVVANEFSTDFQKVFDVDGIDEFDIYSDALHTEHDKVVEFLNKGIETLERLKQLIVAHKEATENEKKND